MKLLRSKILSVIAACVVAAQLLIGWQVKMICQPIDPRSKWKIDANLGWLI